MSTEKEDKLIPDDCDIIQWIEQESDIKVLRYLLQKVQKRIQTVKQHNRDDEFVTEPCAAVLAFSRGYGGAKGLYGSKISHQNFISMRVKSAYTNHQYGHDSYYGDELLLEVEMSASQFAEAITSLNMGDGVPVTLRYTQLTGVIDKPEVPDFRQILNDDILEHVADSRKLVRDARRKAEEIVAKKSMNKADREEILSLLNRLEISVGSDTMFTIEQLQRQLDSIVAESKGEIESFLQQRLTSIAHAAIAKGTHLISTSDNSKGTHLISTSDNSKGEDEDV